MTSPRSRRPSPSCAAATVPWCSTSTPRRATATPPPPPTPRAGTTPCPLTLPTGEILPGAAAHPADENYANVTGALLMDWMHTDPRVVAVNAATPYIMGFTPELRERAGGRFIDVGIAEEHAVSLVTGLARGGARPVLGIYATFLQRAYDQLWHDLCLNDAPATILVFGASAFGTTDVTHLGFFDIPMLGSLPGLTYLAPTCIEEYLDMLSWSIGHAHGPVAIRVPVAGGVVSRPDFVRATDYTSGWETLRQGSESRCSRSATSCRWARRSRTRWPIAACARRS